MDKLILERAQSATLARDFTLAARLYKTLLKQEPENVSLHKALGGIYVKNGEDSKALPYYENVLTYAKDDIEALTSMGGIYRRLKEYEKSTAILERALETGEKTADVNYSLGFTYKEMGNYDDAIDCFESVVAEKPSDVLAYNHLGAIYTAKKDYAKAVQSFRRGLQTDPNHPILHYNLAHTYESQKNYQEAIKEYEMSLKAKPGWIEAIEDYVKLLIKCSKTRTAFDKVQQSVQLYPTNPELHSLLGSVYLKQYDFDNAVESFKKADNYKSDDAKILIGLAESLEKSDKFEQAAAYASKAHEILPDDKYIGKKYTHIMLSANKYDEALEEINKSIEHEKGKKDPRLLDALAQYYICTGNENHAQILFEQISAINPGYQHHLLEAARRYYQKGDTKNAENYVNKYNEGKVPLNPAAYNLLGRIAERNGDDRKAMEAFRKGTEGGMVNVQGKKETQRLKVKMESNQRFADLQNDSFVRADEAKAQALAEMEALEESKKIDDTLEIENEDQLVNNSDEAFDFNILGDDVPATENEEIEEEIMENPDNEEDVVSDTEVPLLAELGEDEGLNPFDDIMSDTDSILDEEKPEPEPDNDFTYDKNETPESHMDDVSDFANVDGLFGGNEPSESEKAFGETSDTPLTGNPANPVFDNEIEPGEDGISFGNDDFSDVDSLFSGAGASEAKKASGELGETPGLTDGAEVKSSGAAPSLNETETSGFPTVSDLTDFEDRLQRMEENARHSDFATDAMAEDAIIAARRAEESLRELEQEQAQLREDVSRVADERTEQVMQYAEEKAREVMEKAEESARRMIDEEINGSYSDLGTEFGEPAFGEETITDPFGDEIIFDSVDTFFETETSDVPETDGAESEMTETEISGSAESEEEIVFDDVNCLLGDDASAADDETETYAISDEEIAEKFFTDFDFPTVNNLFDYENEIEAEDSGTVVFHDEEETFGNVENLGDVSEENKTETETETEPSPLGLGSGFLSEIADKLEDKEAAKKYASELVLFKKLRELTESLPDEDRESFLRSKNRLLLDYVIARLSGKAGLFEVADQIAEKTVETSGLSGEMLSKSVIEKLSVLSESLEDKNLASALQDAAADLLKKL